MRDEELDTKPHYWGSNLWVMCGVTRLVLARMEDVADDERRDGKGSALGSLKFPFDGEGVG
ncbi:MULTISPECIES: hypothetical protein [unclassified Mycobacterium]|uniref:hypothetical protein n=1 Tax=unclassified Mycobacterium TaxID=2642494 RepID=UPI0012EA191B|nr:MULTISPECIES: hypothetical protein [unclassified Mycobacterium]